jgi:hypothetical protein
MISTRSKTKLEWDVHNTLHRSSKNNDLLKSDDIFSPFHCVKFLNSKINHLFKEIFV